MNSSFISYEAYRKSLNAKIEFCNRNLIRNGRLPITEAYCMYGYAIDVIKGRWIEAEDFIMTDPMSSFRYAVDVIGDKLPDKMHNMMILHGIKDPNDFHVLRYFSFLENPTEKKTWEEVVTYAETLYIQLKKEKTPLFEFS